MNARHAGLFFAFASGIFFGGWSTLRVLDSRALPDTSVRQAVPLDTIQPRPEMKRG